MSVINQVLVELEKRRASGAECGTLPDHVRALPEGGSDNRRWWLAAAGGAALALAGLTWLALSGLGWAPSHSTAAAVPPSGPETVIARVVAASAATVTDTTPRELAPDIAAAAPLPVGRLSLELSRAPAPQQIAETEPGPGNARDPISSARVLERAGGADHRPVASAETTTPAPAVAVAAPPSRVSKAVERPAAVPVAEKAAPAGKSGVDKQVHQATARELSDNEYRKAAGSLHQGRLQEALEGFRAALTLYPGHHGARQALVALLVEGKAHAEAERVLQEGIKLAPEQIGFAMTLARLQVDRGDGPGAVATLQAHLAYAQGSPDYAAFLAALQQRQGRHDQAIEQFQAALRAKPATGVWWLGLAISLQAVNRVPEAQDAYRRAKTTNNLNPELMAFADQRLRQLQ